MDHKNHIFVFSGNLSLTIDRKIAAWRENFIAKHGEFAVSVVVLETVEPNILAGELTSGPFLASARLIIVRWASKVSSQYASIEYWDTLFAAIPATNFVVFHETNDLPELSKVLEKNATIKDFSITTLPAAIEYIENELPSLNPSIVSKIATALLQNIPLLQSEVAKLALLPDLTAEEALANCSIRSEKELFKALDALMLGNPAEAIELLQLVESTNPFEMLSEVTRALRKPALYTELILSGYSMQNAQIATGIKDYPAKKYAAGSLRNKRAFIDLYKELCQLDVKSKTGALGSTESTVGEHIMSAFLNYHFCLHSA